MYLFKDKYFGPFPLLWHFLVFLLLPPIFKHVTPSNHHSSPLLPGSFFLPPSHPRSLPPSLAPPPTLSHLRPPESIPSSPFLLSFPGASASQL
ncbi:hypothetical protein GQ53DRAFT_81646 [Thozetella sp. PMI_491]|nr:hypothetical protein GQ53DRAFT_81646 [Thozetella sp. PMI_491]